MDTTTVADSTDSLVAEVKSANDTTIEVTDLGKLHQYWFALYLTTQSGVPSKSNTVVNYPVILKQDSDTSLAADSTIALVWSESVSAKFEAYKLFRSKEPGITGEFKTPMAVIEKSYVTDFTDSGLDSGTTYYYRIIHFELNDLGISESAGSNEIKVTTK
jgi:hypothetical protein